LTTPAIRRERKSWRFRVLILIEVRRSTGRATSSNMLTVIVLGHFIRAPQPSWPPLGVCPRRPDGWGRRPAGPTNPTTLRWPPTSRPPRTGTARTAP
jgi:hypothetical protein